MRHRAANILCEFRRGQNVRVSEAKAVRLVAGVVFAGVLASCIEASHAVALQGRRRKGAPMVQCHLFTRAHTCMMKKISDQKISHHGARSHRQALWFMRQPNMNEKKESLICTAL